MKGLPYLTTAQAAKRLGVSMARVRQLLAAGRLRSVNPTGTLHLIEARTVEALARAPRPAGRPRKKTS